MISCPTSQQLALFLAEELPGPEHDYVETHLETCPSCQDILERLTAERFNPFAKDRSPVDGQPPLGCEPSTQRQLPFLEELANQTPARQLMPCADGLSETDRNDEDRVYAKLPGYEILELLGQGGMGVVYKAKQQNPCRVVAVKMVAAGLPPGSTAWARFRNEIQAIARLHHPHIVQIYEVGEHDGRPFFSMEYVDGGSLAQQLRGTPFAVRQAAQLVEILARAMHQAHQQGIVHRDLKPGNILLSSLVIGHSSMATIETGKANDQGLMTNDRRLIPKITDFGLAKILADERQPLSAQFQTQSGVILGTPSYMAPEQAAGQTRDIGPGADIYALGAILYELLTGRPPFRAETSLETLQQVTNEEPVPPSRLRPGLHADLQIICLKCLQKEPARRYRTAADLADDLQRFLRDEPIRARRVTRRERLWHWCRRNRLVAALLVGLLAVLVVGLAGVTWKWQEAVQAQDEANARAEQIRRDLEGLQAVYVLVENAELHVFHGRWEAADADYTKAVQTRPDLTSPWNERGVFYTRMGLWPEAAADFAQAFRCQEPATPYGWYRQALFRAYVGDTAGYHTASERMRERFGGTADGLARTQLAAACLLWPGVDAKPAELLALAEQADGEQQKGAWKLFLLGKAHYRAGQYAEALRRLRDSLAADPQWDGRIFNYPVLAMVYHRLGQSAEARQALEAAGGAYEAWLQSLAKLYPDLRPTPWAVWIEFQVHYREARLLLQGTAPEDPRLQALRDRSLAALHKAEQP
jgi:serine/threonine protein kinase/Tfp pilus assembly protein PilF